MEINAVAKERERGNCAFLLDCLQRHVQFCFASNLSSYVLIDRVFFFEFLFPVKIYTLYEL